MTTDSAPDQETARERAAARSPEVVRSPEAERRLALLWDPPEPSGRGRPASLTVADVVDTGLSVVAAGGLEALSMRRVARELGVGAMTLYTYVPGRTELVDLMTDRVYGELRHAPPGTPWRPALSQWLTESWELNQRHPWLLQTNSWRAPLAPSVLDAQEAGARCLVDTALSATQVTQTMSLVEAALQGSARAAIAEAAEGRATGVGVDDYWASLSSFWEDYFDVERYPVMTRLYNAGGYDQISDTFESIRDQLLDTVERAIEQAANQG